MSQLKTVGVKELKNRLSAYLREVGTGVRVLVTDRGRVVAELRRPGPESAQDPRDALMAQWVARGRLIPPRGPRERLEASPVEMEDGYSQRLLDLERGD